MGQTAYKCIDDLCREDNSRVGFVLRSYVGLNELQGYLINKVSEQLGGIPSTALNIAYIAGVGVSLNWIFGTFAFIASLKAITKLSAGLGSKV